MRSMILVYEYASRGSLDRYLSDASTLTWIQRLRICVGAARGLCFLHDPKETQQRVLHRDHVKSANILLDENWTAKLSDFGLSKVGPANQAHTYLISHRVGTLGYCDPLYMELCFLSKESDVYSFGVVLFEVMCGRLCYEYQNCELTKILVPKWRQCYDEKRLDEIILPGLKEQMDSGCLKLFSAIAYRCVKKAREERPTMAEIVEELEFSLEKQEIYENTPESSHREKTSSLLFDQMDQSLVLSDDFDAYHFRTYPSALSPNSDNNVLSTSDSDRDDSYDLEDGLGVDSLQIVGYAKPGGKLLACGFPVRGTSSCMIQWVRHFKDGTWKYIEGATNPEYVVTADDFDNLIAIECIPTDSRGQQGKVVRLFANDQNKITCDMEMQKEIDNYMSAGRASFNATLLMGSSESGEQIKVSMRRSRYQIKFNRTQDIFIHEKYSSDLSVKIPSGVTTQFELRRPDGSSHTFSFHDVRMRDTFVLTMRMFQRKSHTLLTLNPHIFIFNLSAPLHQSCIIIINRSCSISIIFIISYNLIDRSIGLFTGVASYSLRPSA
ncbi:hypothetical protein QVD17_26869 [Tagetes erecta]|uniref:Protein kinase domain-containing protein n=1 Tax=Tagetes erecta TaxID=13708 RepID=A0AAD8NIX0_TARER|nr:hypothetical protein QVD17_26869 [Tagetes erecta]